MTLLYASQNKSLGILSTFISRSSLFHRVATLFSSLASFCTLFSFLKSSFLSFRFGRQFRRQFFTFSRTSCSGGGIIFRHTAVAMSTLTNEEKKRESRVDGTTKFGKNQNDISSWYYTPRGSTHRHTFYGNCAVKHTVDFQCWHRCVSMIHIIIIMCELQTTDKRDESRRPWSAMVTMKKKRTKFERCDSICSRSHASSSLWIPFFSVLFCVSFTVNLVDSMQNMMHNFQIFFSFVWLGRICKCVKKRESYDFSYEIWKKCSFTRQMFELRDTE